MGLLVLVCMAPVVGDIGSCGQEVEELDPPKFFQLKAQIDCERCQECGIVTRSCEIACGFRWATEFEPGCFPLVHDGEVCLNALDAASCAEYRDYMADEGASTPTECNFCPPEDRT